MANKNNEINMLEGPLLKGLFIFSVPLMITNVLQLLFNAADIVIVGKFAGDIYTAAVSATEHIVFLLTNFGIGLSIGVNVLVARLIGENNKNKISDAIHTSILFAIILGVAIMVLSFFVSVPALKIMDTPSEVIDLSALYLKIYFMGAPVNLLYNYGSAVLRAKGDTKRPLYYLMLAGVLNVLLNVIMVVIFDMNVAGVAIATVASQAISAFLILRILVKEDGVFKLSFTKLRINGESLKEVIKLGLPAGIQNSLFSISNVILQSYVNSFGTDVIAASGISHSAESIANGIVGALETTIMTFVSQNYGAKNYKRIKESTLLGILICCMWCGLFAFITATSGKFILSFYSNSPAIIDIGYERMKIFMYTYISITMMHLGSGVLRGVGYSMIPTTTCLVGVCGVRLLCVWVIFKDNITFLTVMWAYPISWIVTAIVVWIFLLYQYFKNKVLFE